MAVTWGDGSGNGCGGPFNWFNCDEDLEASTMETWLSVWGPTTVHNFFSNWKEMRTLKATLE